jgi:hypothetical protein
MIVVLCKHSCVWGGEGWATIWSLLVNPLLILHFESIVVDNGTQGVDVVLLHRLQDDCKLHVPGV